jgi:hypothetical protein
MHKFPITNYKRFSDLPLEVFDSFRFNIYLLDFNWNYLFVNTYVKENLGPRGDNLVGKNMWETFPELKADPSFQQMRSTIEQGNLVHITTTSPITTQRLNITGYALEDCYYFSSSKVPDKVELLNELRNILKKPTP